jgi:elongation factor Ts
MASTEVSALKVRDLRDMTGAGVMDCKRALSESGGDLEQAIAVLRARGVASATRKAGRETKDGQVYAYIHPGGRVGVLIEVGCETDFVARTDDFQNLCRELAMQVAATEVMAVTELLDAPYIRDPGQKAGDLVTAAIAKLGENINVRRFTRYRLGVLEG